MRAFLIHGVVALFAVGGCTQSKFANDTIRFDDQSTDGDDEEIDDTVTNDGDPVPDDGPEGFVGGPCDSDADCPYEGGLCLFEDDGFPNGTCSAACEQYCPDLEGHPVTFCVDSLDLPVGTGDIVGDGGCVSRCDYGHFPDSGCRPGYGCVTAPRANEPGTETYVCLPGEASELGACYAELAATGAAFSPTIIADASPSTHPNLNCHVEDPVQLHSPVDGIDLQYFSSSTPGSVKGSCEMALSIVDTMADVKPYDVKSMLHMGTYNCRVISGTDSLSRHAYGDAVDIYGFDMSDGGRVTLEGDWQHDTTNPSGFGAEFLYDAAYRWHEDEIWNIILTPNYNDAHDNHFHVDLTPGSDYIRWSGYIGPNETSD